MYAMSNISKEDYAVLSTKLVDWSIFNRVFTSGHVDMLKPDLDFYRHVPGETKLAPEDAIFIDDKAENVSAVESVGIKSIVFDDSATVIRILKNILEGPVERGYQYLYRNAKRFDSITQDGLIITENFSQLLILDAVQDR